MKKSKTIGGSLKKIFAIKKNSKNTKEQCIVQRPDQAHQRVLVLQYQGRKSKLIFY